MMVFLSFVATGHRAIAQTLTTGQVIGQVGDPGDE